MQFTPGCCACADDPPPCEGAICFTVRDRCTVPVEGASVSVTGAGTGSCTTASTGRCCVAITAAGTYHYEVSYPGLGTVTGSVTVACETTEVAVTLPTLGDPDEPYPSSDWLVMPCCACHRFGRRADRVPKTLYATFNGPVEIFGGLSGVPIQCNWDPTSNDGNTICGSQAACAMVWDSGCLGGSGASGTCNFGSLFCRSGDCAAPAEGFYRRIIGEPAYGSCRVRIIQYTRGFTPDPVYTGCATRVLFENFWGTDCTDVTGAPSCSGALDGAKFCRLDCNCAFPGGADEVYQSNYPRSLTFENVGALAGPLQIALCGPVNYSQTRNAATSNCPAGIPTASVTLTE